MRSILTLPMKTTAGLVLFLVAITGFAAEFRLPAFEKIQLANGLTVVMMERHDVPLIAMRTVLKAGAVSDGKQGSLANLKGDALL